MRCLKADPLLTKTPTERLIKPHMAGRDNSSGAWVVHQVSVGVCGVANKNALECCVSHLATLVCWNVDESRAAEDPQVLQVWGMSICECDWDPVDTAVVDPIVQMTCCQHCELPVAHR